MNETFNPLANPHYLGPSISVVLPSRRVIQIREANGMDEELLTNPLLVENGTNMTQYLAAICRKDDGNSPITAEEMDLWPNNDIYFAIMKSRILNFGEELTFNHICYNSKCQHKFPVSDDLRAYSVYPDTPHPEVPRDETSVMYYPGKLSPNDEGVYTGKFNYRGMIYEFDYLNRKLELKASEEAEELLNKNTPLKIRNLRVSDSSSKGFTPITVFSAFPAKIISELRAIIAEQDPTYNPHLTITCPKCNKPQSVPIFKLGDFYYPGESL